MRLSRIKLAGFKSFVDPTTIHLPGDLLAVVGPNGCGKSNIIDAVRWVMGEGSAKILRGESMADVIFNGTRARKPVGTATVELTFDNADGSVGGQYADYAEIAVKRVVSRDGHSQYFLNGTRCRRRDITDLFLGTGLGPRSYSIIEQGMISQVIEAHPDELRGYLEEAAGISKYKERRRETEHRIRRTRENLERLDDLREEVDKHLERLKRQARAARRYSKLKDEQRQVRAEHLCLSWRALKNEAESKQGEVRAAQTRLEAATAEQRRHEAAIERTREEQQHTGERFNKVQGEVYEVAAEVARLEQAIQHVKDLHQRQVRDLAEADETWGELNDHIALDEVQVEQMQTELGEGEPELKRVSGQGEAAADRLAAVESERAQWREAWDRHLDAAGEDARSAEVARTRIDELDKALARLTERRERLAEERGEHDTRRLGDELERMKADLEEAAGEKSRLETRLDEVRLGLEDTRAEVDDAATHLDGVRQQLQEDGGRLSSLEALQQSALGADEEDVQAWLQAHGLADARRLAEVITVEPGWETAVETVLGDRLGALVCDGFETHLAALGELSRGRIRLVRNNADDEFRSARVRGPAVLADFFGGVHFVEDLAQARARYAALPAGESVVTRTGEWLGPRWAAVQREDSTERNTLKREKEINELRESVERLTEELETGDRALEAARQRLLEQEEKRDELQEAFNAAHRHHAGLEAQSGSRASRLEASRKRLAQIDGEDRRAGEEIRSCEEALREARGGLEGTVERMADHETRRGELESRRETLDERYRAARAEATDLENRRQELNVTVERLRTGLESTETALGRMRSQLEQLTSRREQLKLNLAETDSPLEDYQKALNAQLDRRLEADKRLSAAREELNAVDERLREFDRERAEAEKAVADVRDGLEERKLEQQRLAVKQEDVETQIAEAGFDADETAANLPEEARTEDWETRLEDLDRRIRRLEPVNLAAISEFDEESERKEYLDSQNEDLLEALATLESAIHKIDRQTRTGFKETFDRVNAGLQELFPRLFGGGHAYLQLTGDDLLTTGVAIMARPPGKRIARINLLSGGEKALAAVSFVFAIFRLNPAPFCLLDEVDAPLDDTNVGRVADLIREMSEQVQFIVVTHNKVTMEDAFQLVGVTMREAGVSRLVSVDIDAAAELATA